MLSEGSPNVNRPACGKKFRKINKQFLYHRDPMCPPKSDQQYLWSLLTYLIGRTPPSPPITIGHFLAYPHPPPQK